MIRVLLASTTLMALWSLATSLRTSYNHDGKTTYCWHINEPVYVSNLTEQDRTDYFSGSHGCPIAMTIALDATTVKVNTPVNVSWTVHADFSDANLVNMTQLGYGQDSSGHIAQIVHSNVHSCVYQSGCDPFNSGRQLEDKTANQIANLTDNAADFKDGIQFSSAGPYSVLAHIIMPDSNNSSKQFAYAVYVELTVTEANNEDSTNAPTAILTEKSSGISQAAIIGIIGGGVVFIAVLLVVALIVWRRHGSNNMDMNTQYYPPPPPYDSASVARLVDLKDNVSISDADTARATGSWGNPSHGIVARSLDGTNGSNGSHNSYHVPQDRFYGAARSDYQRRRVDSDIEL